MGFIKKKLPESIRERIIENPDLILDDTDLLGLLFMQKKCSSEYVIDIREVFLQRIESKLRNLTVLHQNTIAAAYDIFLGASNLHKAILKILEQTTLQSFVVTMKHDVKEILEVDNLDIIFPVGELENTVKLPLDFISKKEFNIFLRSAKLSKNNLVSLFPGRFYSQKISSNESKVSEVGSEALILLRSFFDVSHKGLLLIGSKNRMKFESKNRTDYLNVLAQVVSHQIFNLIKQAD